MLDKIRQYLSALTISSEQKRYAMNFCKKMNYLNELQAIAIQDTNEYVCTGYGNINSKICFVFKDKATYDIIKPLIQNILDKFDINSWDVYITFVDKTKSEYDRKYPFLVNEIHAVGAKLLYVFDKDDIVYNQIVNAFTTRNINLPEKHFLINAQKLTSTNDEDRKHLWNMFKYLINYKEIE